MLFHLLWRMGAFLCQHEASKIKNTVVRNSFSAVVYTACNITHTIEKPIAAPSVSSENFFRWFYMKEHHWLCTTVIIPPFSQNDTSYSAVVLYKVKRRHCYCTPCSVCKREKFDQFKLCVKIPRPNTILLAWLNDFILGSMRNVVVVLRLNVPVNNFSVMSGRSHRFLGN